MFIHIHLVDQLPVDVPLLVDQGLLLLGHVVLLLVLLDQFPVQPVVLQDQRLLLLLSLRDRLGNGVVVLFYVLLVLIDLQFLFLLGLLLHLVLLVLSLFFPDHLLDVTLLVHHLLLPTTDLLEFFLDTRDHGVDETLLLEQVVLHEQQVVHRVGLSRVVVIDLLDLLVVVLDLLVQVLDLLGTRLLPVRRLFQQLVVRFQLLLQERDVLLVVLGHLHHLGHLLGVVNQVLIQFPALLQQLLHIVMTALQVSIEVFVLNPEAFQAGVGGEFVEHVLELVLQVLDLLLLQAEQLVVRLLARETIL